MRVIIAGSRTFENYEFLEFYCNIILHNLYTKGAIEANMKDVEIISGMANGADKLGERYAKMNRVPCKLFPADWDLYGKSAGYRRNKQMAEYAKEDKGTLIAFWDQLSKGTKNMITVAKACKLYIYEVDCSYWTIKKFFTDKSSTSALVEYK